MVVSFVLAFAIFGCYLVWELVDLPETAKTCLKLFVDASPLIIWLFFRTAPCFVFLLFCFIANMVIFSNNVIGAIVFIVAYCFAAVYASVQYNFDLLKLAGSLGVVAALEAAVLLFYKENRLGVIIYGFTACAACVYAFLVSKNFGFLSLVIADSLLIVNEIRSNKAVFLVSDFFYFLGICLVPLVLR